MFLPISQTLVEIVDGDNSKQKSLMSKPKIITAGKIAYAALNYVIGWLQ